MPGQEGHPENAGNYRTECPEAEPDYPGARAGDSGMHSGVMYGDLSHDTADIGSQHDPGLDVEYFDPNLHYSADHIIEEDDDPGTETIWGDDINCMLPFLDEDPLGMGGDYPLEDRPPYMFFNTGNNDKERQTKEVETVNKAVNYGEGEEASDAGEETTASESEEPTPPTVIEETEINNFYDYEYNYDYQYYFFDVGLQFTPKVGSVFSINTNPYMLYVGSAAQASNSTKISYGNGTAWKPSKTDLPDIIASLGLTYRYAALYDGYWGASSYDLSNDIIPNVPGIASVELESPVDGAETVFERSWQNRHPGMIINEKEEYEDFFADRGNGSLTEVDLDGEPSWMSINKISGYVAENWKEEDKLPDKAVKDEDEIDSMYTGHNFYEWYREDDVTPSTQNAYNASVISSAGKKLSDNALRAIEILGEDILLRDEWVASDAYPHKVTMYSYNTDAEPRDKHFDMYYYIYSNTSVLDPDLGGPTTLLTQDYVIQSLYRALGVNCVRSQVYLYADKYHTINNTPLATQLTVALDKVNQIQNRMDVFVTRANLDKYWEKALTDGLVKDSGRLMYNELDAKYKPFSVQVKSKKLPDPNSASGKVTLAGEDPYVEVKAGAEKANKDTSITYDSARAEKLTLAEFCVLVKRAMDIYGEEVLTEREQDMLLVYYGTRLPYTINDTEQFEAIKYLMAKGIVEGQLCWTDTLTLEDMLVILSRVKDKQSRLTFKEIDLKYDESLLDQGYYPANISYNVGDGIEVSNVTVSESSNYKNSEWFDFFIRLTDESVDDKNGVGDLLKLKPTTYFSNMEGGTLSFEGLRILKLKNNKEWGDTTIFSDMEIDNNPDNCHTVGIKRFADGFYYLHFQVNSKILTDTAVGKKYCNDGKIYITLNNREESDPLQAFIVSKYGGIFLHPSAQKVRYIDSSRKPEHYTVNYSDGDYNSAFELLDLGTKDYKYKEGSTPIYITDKSAISKNKILLSSVTAVSEDGIILKAKQLDKKVNVKANPSKYLSFDEADFSLEYCDYSRYLIGYARSLQEQPYLAGDTRPNFTDSLSNSYDIWFTIVGDGDSKLPDDVYWGDPANGNKVIDKLQPTKPVATDGVSIEFIRKSGNTYYYVLKGQKSVNDVTNKLHFKTGSATANVFTGYVKDNDTILIDVDNLSKLASYGYQFGAEGDTVYTNFAAAKLKPNLLVVTAEDASDSSGNSLLNIYLYDDLKLCIVNNIAYEVPGNEVLYVEREDELGNTKYLINWRAVLGWESGYKVTSVDGDGKIHLGVGFNKGESSYNNTHVINAWTAYEQSLSTITYDGKIILPMTSPYILSNWFVFVSDRKGVFAFVVKNNDKDSSDSTINLIAKDKKGNPFKEADTLYMAGSDMLQKLLGVKLASGGDEWYTEPYIISCYNLSSGVSDYVTTRDKLEAGKFFYDNSPINDSCTGVWCYVVPRMPYNKNLRSGVNGSLYAKLVPTGHEDVRKTYTATLTQFKESYYNGTYPLPIFYIPNKAGKLMGDLVDITCNTYQGQPYGTVPAYAYRPFAITAPGLDYISAKDDPSAGKCGTYVGFNLDNKFIEAPSTVCPTGIAYFVVGDLVYTAKEILDDKDTISTNIKILQGNCVYSAYKSVYEDGYKVSPQSPLKGVVATHIKEDTPLTFVCMSGKTSYYSIDSVRFSYSSERNDLIEEAIRGSLQDIDNPGVIDWQEFTFDRLVHGIDNAFSIILIIALNVIPRVGMFMFVILIGLSVIADIPIWRKFCQNVFDPYKLMTFGHQDVLTINTKLLLVSSMLGLAVFAMFMDGTIIHLLAWLVQFFSGWITL